jgi:copper transport protein
VRLHPRVTPVLLLLAVCTLAALLWSAPQARAHTELVQWGFVQDATTSATTLLLRFSEPIDAHFLTVGVVDLQGERIPAPPVKIDERHKTDGYVELPSVPTGTYSVAWWTRALDGDTSTGSFLIGIGTAVEPLALLPPVGARDPATQPATLLSGTVWNAIFHWFAYLAAALLVGTASFVLITIRPRSTTTDADLLRKYRTLAVTGAGIFLFTGLLTLVMQAGLVRYSLLQPVTSAAPTPLEPSSLSHAAPYLALVEILRGRSGGVWLARMLLAAAALVLALRLAPARRRAVGRWAAILGISLAALFTVSLTAHAAVVPQAAWAIPVDWSHMAVMGLWIGGMLPLMLALRTTASQDITPIVQRFSAQALAAVGFLAATGLLAAYVHVRHPGLLLPTTYGVVLSVKLTFFAVLVGFGALHRRVFIPRLPTEVGAGRTALERALPWELGVGCALLLAVSLMASLGTSAAVWPAHQALGIAETADAGGVRTVLRAVPGRTGENAVALDISDRRNGPATVPIRVTLTVNGVMVELTPMGSPVAGTTQRFAAPSLVQLPDSPVAAVFQIVRPAYQDLSGDARINPRSALP